MKTAFSTLCALAGTISPLPIYAQVQSCSTKPFRGATSLQGAVAHMQVTNSGHSCAILNYGVPSGREHPAHAGSITVNPAHGQASFVAPRAAYTPAPGYVGPDAFEYEALARDVNSQQVRLKVRVEVVVKAP